DNIQYIQNFLTSISNNLNHLANEVLITSIAYCYYPVILLVLILSAIFYFLGKISLIFMLSIIGITLMVFFLFGEIYHSKLNNFINLHSTIIKESFQQNIVDSPFISNAGLMLAQAWTAAGAKGNSSGGICPVKSTTCTFS